MTDLPGVLTPHDAALVAAQYADRIHLRPALDALLGAALDIGDARIVARTRQISLVGPLRTFAFVQSTAKQRIDVRLRVQGPATGRRAVATDGVEYRVRLELRTPGDVDAETAAWLRRAFDENAAPRQRRRPAPRGRPTHERTVPVVVEGCDLPGRAWSSDRDGGPYADVHVGLAGTDRAAPGAIPVTPPFPPVVMGVVRADAPSVRWDVEVVVRRYADSHDVRGPWVRGPRDGRMIQIVWLERLPHGGFTMFRGLGLRFRDIDSALLDRALDGGAALVARLGLTDARGAPLCASVRPPAVRWSIEPVPDQRPAPDNRGHQPGGRTPPGPV